MAFWNRKKKRTRNTGPTVRPQKTPFGSSKLKKKIDSNKKSSLSNVTKSASYHKSSRKLNKAGSSGRSISKSSRGSSSKKSSVKKTADKFVSSVKNFGDTPAGNLAKKYGGTDFVAGKAEEAGGKLISNVAPIELGGIKGTLPTSSIYDGSKTTWSTKDYMAKVDQMGGSQWHNLVRGLQNIGVGQKTLIGVGGNPYSAIGGNLYRAIGVTSKLKTGLAVAGLSVGAIGVGIAIATYGILPRHQAMDNVQGASGLGVHWAISSKNPDILRMALDDARQTEQEIAGVNLNMPIKGGYDVYQASLSSTDRLLDLGEMIYEDMTDEGMSQMSEQELWNVRMAQQDADDRALIDYYNEQSVINQKWNTKNKLATQKKLDKMQREEAQWLADFWLEYFEMKQKLATDTSRSNLNFGGLF